MSQRRSYGFSTPPRGLLGLAVLLGLVTAGIGGAQTPVEPPAEESRQPAPPEPAPETDARPAPTRRPGPRVSIFGSPIHVSADTLQDGVVVGIGTDVVVEGSVSEDVVVVFGTLELTGSVRNNVVSILSDAEIRNAQIGEQLVSVAGRLDLEETDVRGQMVQVGSFDWLPDLPSAYGLLGFLLFWGRLVKMLLAFVTLLLLATLVPDRIRVVSAVAPLRYGTAFFVGLLGYLGAAILMLLLAATVIGLPIGVLVFLVLKWLGIAGILHAFGERLGRAFGREMSLLGAILLVFAPFALLIVLPSFLGLWGLVISAFLGFCVWLFLEVPAVGLMLLTRGGTRTAEPGPAPPPEQPTAPVPSGDAATRREAPLEADEIEP